MAGFLASCKTSQPAQISAMKKRNKRNAMVCAKGHTNIKATSSAVKAKYPKSDLLSMSIFSKIYLLDFLSKV